MATATYKPHFFFCLLWISAGQANDEGVSAQITMSGECPYIMCHLWIRRSRAWTTLFRQSARALTFCNLWVCDSTKVWDRTCDEGTPWPISARSIVGPQLMSRIGDSTVPHMPNSTQNHSYFCSLTSLSMASYLRWQRFYSDLTILFLDVNAICKNYVAMMPQPADFKTAKPVKIQVKPTGFQDP